jgi:prolyl oligopeptidase
MFVLHRTDLKLDGNRPTVLYGYGGFNVNQTPGFITHLPLWLDAGGIFCVANLRGGGEYGEEWHRAGMLGNKQNVFDDFIAAAEWLIANGYTNQARLAISGASNGGLLVGAALTQRPDLFRAVVCRVPLLDMLRYHHFRIAKLWTREYGSADDPAQFRWLYAYSPYHHVEPGVNYPAVLLTTAESDSRVDPMHAFKMAARLQAASAPGSDRPILLRVESKAGHGAGKPLSKIIDEQCDVWSFLFEQLGVESVLVNQ